MKDADVGRALCALWEDQEAFNELVRGPAPTIGTSEFNDVVRELALGTESEIHDLLRVLTWKRHRNTDRVINAAHIDEELVDLFKMFMSIAQLFGMTPERLVAGYWPKTLVVRQRYQEEWLARLDSPCALIDIDGVICNYVGGLLWWLVDQKKITTVEASEIEQTKSWIDQSTFAGRLATEEWAQLKHEFRTSGAKQRLPMMPGAKVFLSRLQQRGLKVVLLTSRPFDRYPNMYTDTLQWLRHNDLAFDYLWWGLRKVDRVMEGNAMKHVQFSVDDDMTYANEYARHGIRSYLYSTQPNSGAAPGVRHVRSLADILTQEDVEPLPATKDS